MRKILSIIAVIATVFAAVNMNAQCYNATYGLWPASTFTPTCNGVFANVTTSGYASEYSNVNLVAGNTYVFRSSRSTDYITVDNNGTAPLVGVVGVSGTAGVSWTCTATGTYRFYTHVSASCGSSTLLRTRSVRCTTASAGSSNCTNTTAFGSATINTNGTSVSISSCSYAGEYSTIFGAVSGQSLRFTSSAAGDYITVRSGSPSGAVVAQGTTPLTFTNTFTGTLYVHWNLANSCGSQSSCRSTTVQCLSCTAPPAIQNDLCGGAISISCGSTVTVNTANATTDAIGSSFCGTTITTAGVWYKFTGNGQNITVSTVGLTSTDSKIIVYSGTCAGLTCVGGNDDFSGLQSQVSWSSVNGTTYYILAATFSGTGSFPMSLTCTAPPPPYNPCNTVSNIASCGVSSNINIGSGNGLWSSFGGPFSTPGKEQIFTFTPTVTASYPITVTNNGSGWIDLFVKTTASGCNNSGWTYIDDISGTATNNVTLTAGVTYYFLLDDEDSNGSTGSISLGCPCIGSSNDGSFTYSSAFSISGTTVGACDDSPLRSSFDRIYAVNISCAGTYTFATCGSSFDTYLYLTTAAGGGGTILAFNDDGCSLQSSLTASLNAGTYYIVVEGFSSTSVGAFTLNVSGTGSAPSITGSTTDASCNGSSNGTLSATVSGNGNTATATLNGNAFNGSASCLAAGTYTVVATNCWGSTTQTYTVSEPTVLSAASTSGSIACNGGSTTVTVSATGGTAPYSGTGTFTVTAGTYSYTVTDANGCTSTTSITVSEPTLLTAANVTSDFNGFGISCNGGSNGSITVSANGGTAPYSGDGANAGLAAGTYNYTVTDANGCTATTGATLTEPTDLVSAASAGQILCFGGSTNVGVTATGGVAPYSGTGNNVEVAGTYNYTVTDANGCTDVASVTVTQPDLLVASSSSGAIACFGGSTTVEVTATGGTAPYVNTGNYTVTSGTSRYVIQDANGCVAITTINITEPDLLVASYTAGTIACFGATAPVTVSAVGGTEPYTGTGTFNTPAGATQYTVTDANGCTSSVVVRLSQPSQVRVDAGQDKRVYFGYGPLACATLSANALGGTGAITYQWFDNNGNLVASGSSTTVCPSTTTNYTVVATDANGCTASDVVAVCVTDVTCAAGNSGNLKVQICTRNNRTLCVSPSAVPAHLRNGATLGSCSERSCTVTSAREMADDQIVEEYASDKAAGEMLDVQIFPNPTSGLVNINISASEQVFEVQVFDAMGRLVNSVKNQSADRTIMLNLTDLPSGVYMVRISGEAGFVVKQIVRD